MATNSILGIFASSAPSGSFSGADVRRYQDGIATRSERAKLRNLAEREQSVVQMLSDLRNPLRRRVAVESYAGCTLEELPAADDRTSVLVEVALDPKPYNGHGRIGQVEQWMREHFEPVRNDAADLLRDLNGRLASRLDEVTENARAEVVELYAKYGCAGAVEQSPVLAALRSVAADVRASSGPDFRLGSSTSVAQAVAGFLRE